MQKGVYARASASVFLHSDDFGEGMKSSVLLVYMRKLTRARAGASIIDDVYLLSVLPRDATQQRANCFERKVKERRRERERLYECYVCVGGLRETQDHSF